MIRRLFLALALAGLVLGGPQAALAQIQAPEQFFGFRIGTDGEMARYPKVLEYMQHLAKQSDRVSYEELGKTTMGESYVLVTISAPGNLAKMDRYVEINRRLADPRGLRRRLGYLPQDFGVYPRIPAFDLLDHLAVLKGVSDKAQRHAQVDSLLALTNLYDVRKRAVSTFSGGMKQRFGIAQALLGDPALVIVDEPTAGLDPEERNRFHDLLSEIGENVVVLLSTHIVDDVSDLCTRMAVLAGGRVLVQGRPSDLIAQLDGRVWRKTVRKDAVAHYRETQTLLSARLFAGETRIHVLAEERPEEGFERITPDLEDVYFSVLGSSPGRGRG